MSNVSDSCAPTARGARVAPPFGSRGSSCCSWPSGSSSDSNSPAPPQHRCHRSISVGRSAAHDEQVLRTAGEPPYFPPRLSGTAHFLCSRSGFFFPSVITRSMQFSWVSDCSRSRSACSPIFPGSRSRHLLHLSAVLVVIKHFTLPLTDVPFFCCSMCCLALLGAAIHQGSSLRFLTLALSAWLLALPPQSLCAESRGFRFSPR